MNGPYWMYFHKIPMQDKSFLDQFFGNVVYLFMANQMYVCFALVFGHNIYIFMSKLGEKEYVSFYIKLLVLLVFGIAHGVLFFWGDILSLFAISAIPLALNFKTKLRHDFLLLACVISIYMVLSLWSLSWDDSGGALQSTVGFASSGIYQSGGLIEVIKQRAVDFFDFNFRWLFDVSVLNYTLGTYMAYLEFYIFMLLGLIAAKSRFFYISKHLLGNRSLMLIFAFCYLSLVYLLFKMPEFKPYLGLLKKIMHMFFFVLLMYQLYSSKLLASLSLKFIYAGRNSLSLYVFCSIFFSLILSGYGFGLYQRVGPAFLFCFGLALLGLILSIIGSNSVLPLEKLWRKIVYKS